MSEPRWLDAEQMREWRSFLTATTLLFAKIDDEAKRYDISHSEYGILVLLSEAPENELRMALLADALAHSRSRVTHTVKRMETKGLVQRTTVDDDRRGVVCRLLPGGMDLLREAAPSHAAAVLEHLFDLASREDLAAMARVMDAVADDLGEAHPEMDLR